MQVPIYSFASEAASRNGGSRESSQYYADSSQELINLDDEIGYPGNKRVMNDEVGVSVTQFGNRLRRVESGYSGDETVENNELEGLDVGVDDDGPQEHELNSESAAHGPLPKRAKVAKTTETTATEGRKNLSIVWQYFTKVEVKEKGAMVRKVRCTVCGAMFADSSTNKSGGSTGKYRQHLMSHTVKNSAASRQSVLNVGQLKGGPNKALAGPTSSDLTAIVESNIIKWMVATSKPFMEVESEYFRAIFDCIPGLGPLFKSASTATTRILELYMSQKSELKAEMAATAISVSISLDGWTSPTKSAMFAIIAHWITADWEAREAVLHIIELQGSHTGLALAEEVLRCSRFYDITNKLIAISSDNASNNAAMVDVLEESITNSSAKLDEDSDSEFSADGRLSDGEETDFSGNAPGPSTIMHDDNSLRTIIYASQTDLSADQVIQNLAMVPAQPLFRGRRSWVRCIAHSLNLVVKVVLQRLDFDVGQNIDNDDVLILKPNKIVGKIRKVAKGISNELQSVELG
ncbi:hypothetical protein V1525DRAFT_459207 [Lipomyces kononenkoae]|uniref:Uncharacterized protein n=1 Tax=Lipomyces kononenkoae TaxID=34357 RepID=A0ACC3SSP2_LIPKO